MRRGPDGPDLERMREEIERACAGFAAGMEDISRRHHQRRQDRETRRGLRAERRMARCAPGGFWQWWMIFPLVFFVIPALSDNRAWDRGWDRAGDGIGRAAERLFDGWTGVLAAPFTALARLFGDLIGVSTETAMVLLIAAFAVNATVIVLALTVRSRRA